MGDTSRREEIDRAKRELDRLHKRARERGVNPIVYWISRAILQPFFHLYFRLSRIGRENIPATGPVIFASNHRSFLDPFIIGVLNRRPVYYVAKSEIFKNPFVAWFVSSLGAFPVRRGAGDPDMLETARAILERGDCVLIFPEGTRTRPGSLGRPKRGVGRLALETGAPVVPVALIGTEAVRRGWRIRPKKIRARIGRPLTFPKVDPISPQLAAAVTDRIWPNVMLQWEWLGGLPPLRRAAVVGEGAWATSLAAALRRAKIEVDQIGVAPTDHSRHDLVVFAVPGCRAGRRRRGARGQDRAAHRRAGRDARPDARRHAPDRLRVTARVGLGDRRARGRRRARAPRGGHARHRRRGVRPPGRRRALAPPASK